MRLRMRLRVPGTGYCRRRGRRRQGSRRGPGKRRHGAEGTGERRVAVVVEGGHRTAFWRALGVQ